jgi:hypothetical protein
MEQIKQELNNKILGYILAGLGLVAGLAWNDAIKTLIEYLFPLEKNGLWAKFLYAILITLVVVILSVYLTRIFKRKE